MTVTMEPGSLDLTSADTFVEHGVPHSYFRFMREHHPVWYQDLGDGKGYWHLFRYQDIQRVSRDPETFISSRGFTMGEPGPTDLDSPPDPAAFTLALIQVDPPRHQKLRSLINKGFTPRRVAAMEPHIRDISREIINNVCEKGSVDFVEEIAAVLPLAVICELLGVPDEDRPAMFDASNRAMGASDPEYATAPGDDAMDVMQYLFGYFKKLLDDRKQQRRDDLISVLLDAEVDGEKLDEMEILNFCFILVIAGNETTRNGTTHGLITLLDHPEQTARLRQDPSLLPQAVDEIVRYCSPVMHMTRTCTKDSVLSGQTIRRGDRVVLWYPSANRDAEFFDDPDTFNIDRTGSDHLGFGYGEHFCLGANLARLELRIIFEEIIRRLPDIHATGEPARLHNALVAGIKHLPVAFTPAARE